MIIPILIPTGYNYQCTVSGSVFQAVQCEHCQFVYVYKMTRTGSGIASESLLNSDPYAAQQAESAATFDLRQKLRDDCDAVPCLECGKYQDHMVDALKRDYELGWRNLGWLFLGVGILAGIIGLITLLWEMRDRGITLWLGAGAIFLVATGAVILLWRRRCLRRYEPNQTDLAERMQISARYARTFEQFKEYLKLAGIEWELPRLDENRQTPSESRPNSVSADSFQQMSQ